MESMNPEYVIRTQSDWAHTYGLGEKVADNCYLFRVINDKPEYGLSLAEAKQLLARKTQVKKAH
jgi:hypothetical protein